MIYNGSDKHKIALFEAVEKKQDKLTAGSNIELTPLSDGTVRIDASGGGGGGSSGIKLFTTYSGTISTETQIGYADFSTAEENSFIFIAGTLSGTTTTSDVNSIVTLNIYVDAESQFSLSQICIDGSHTISFNVALEIPLVGNHLASVSCAVTDGTFVI